MIHFPGIGTWSGRSKTIATGLPGSTTNAWTALDASRARSKEAKVPAAVNVGILY
jgi:hypothetical protein